MCRGATSCNYRFPYLGKWFNIHWSTAPGAYWQAADGTRSSLGTCATPALARPLIQIQAAAEHSANRMRTDCIDGRILCGAGPTSERWGKIQIHLERSTIRLEKSCDAASDFICFHTSANFHTSPPSCRYHQSCMKLFFLFYSLFWRKTLKKRIAERESSVIFISLLTKATGQRWPTPFIWKRTHLVCVPKVHFL